MDQDELTDKIVENKGIVVTALLALVLGLGVYFFMSQQKSSRLQTQADSLYDFEKNEWEKLEQKKITWEEIRPIGEELLKDHIPQGNALSLLLKISAYLAIDHQEKKAASFLETYIPLYRKGNKELYLLLATAAATYYEDGGDLQKAVDLFEDLNTSGTTLFKANRYLSLGRLYRSLENKEKSVANLKYFVEHYPKHFQLQLAEILLKKWDS